LKNYRGKLDIIADILQVVSQKAKKTHIMHKANLSYTVLKKYLEEVTEASLVSFNTAEHCYVLTQRGQEFLEAYKDYDRTNKRMKKRFKDVDSKKKNLENFCSTK